MLGTSYGASALLIDPPFEDVLIYACHREVCHEDKRAH